MPDTALEAAMQNPAIIRNRRKLWAIRNNAQAVQRVQAAIGSFDAYIWGFTAGRQIVNRPRTSAEIPAQSDLSVRVAKYMKTRGFQFVGPTTIYSFLQGAGIIDDHLAGWQQPEA
jgi:DNA-3-methyladenine glycosylase I